MTLMLPPDAEEGVLLCRQPKNFLKTSLTGINIMTYKENSPGTVMELVQKCTDLVASGNIDTARLEASKLEEVVPPNIDVWRKIYGLFTNIGDFTRAHIFTERMVGREVPEVHLAAATYWARSPNNWPLAREALKKALAGTLPDDASFWQEVVCVQYRLEDYDGVVRSAPIALRLDPARFDIHEFYLVSLSKLGMIRDARRQAEVCVKYAGDDPVRLASLSLICAEIKHKRLAQACCSEAEKVTVEPNYLVHFRLLQAKIVMHDHNGSLQHLSYLADDTKNDWIWKKLYDSAVQHSDFKLAVIAGERLMRLRDAPPDLADHLVKLRKAAASASRWKLP